MLPSLFLISDFTGLLLRSFLDLPNRAWIPLPLLFRRSLSERSLSERSLSVRFERSLLEPSLSCIELLRACSFFQLWSKSDLSDRFSDRLALNNENPRQKQNSGWSRIFFLKNMFVFLTWLYFIKIVIFVGEKPFRFTRSGFFMIYFFEGPVRCSAGNTKKLKFNYSDVKKARFLLKKHEEITIWSKNVRNQNLSKTIF